MKIILDFVVSRICSVLGSVYEEMKVKVEDEDQQIKNGVIRLSYLTCVPALSIVSWR